MTFFKINTDQLTPSCINYIPVATNKSWLDFFSQHVDVKKKTKGMRFMLLHFITLS